MAEQPSEEVRQITEIRRVIVSAKTDPDYEDDAVRDIPHQVVEPGVVRSAMPAEQDRGGLHWAADEPDEVARARARLDKMRGVN
jgi:hypothetical protein